MGKVRDWWEDSALRPSNWDEDVQDAAARVVVAAVTDDDGGAQQVNITEIPEPWYEEPWVMPAAAAATVALIAVLASR